MGLETATYIDGLNADNPVHENDTVGQGDDHIRLLKSTIKASFPAITGAVSVSQTILNYLSGSTGVTGAGNIVRSITPTFNGTMQITGAINCSGTVNGSEFFGNLNAASIHAGVLANARVAQSNVTQHEAALSLTKSQISDLGSPLYAGDVASSLSIGAADTTLSRDAAGQLAVEGAAVFTHNDGALTSGKVYFSNGVEPTTEGNNGDIFLVY